VNSIARLKVHELGLALRRLAGYDDAVGTAKIGHKMGKILVNLYAKDSQPWNQVLLRRGQSRQRIPWRRLLLHLDGGREPVGRRIGRLPGSNRRFGIGCTDVRGHS